MNLASMVRKISELLGRVSLIAWVFLVILVAISVTWGISVQMVSQYKIANQYAQELALLRQARIDLVKGYLAHTQDPEGRASIGHLQGVVLVDQGLEEMGQALQIHTQNTRTMTRAIMLDYIESVKEFRKALVSATPMPAGAITPQEDVILRKRLDDVFLALEERARDLDARLETELDVVKLESVKFFSQVLGIATIILISLTLLVYTGSRSRRQAEQALVESEARFRAMLEGVEQIALIVDRHGNVIFCNKYLASLLGSQPGEVLGHNWFEYFSAFKPGQTLAELEELIAAGDIPAQSESRLTRAGVERLVAFNNYVLRDTHERVQGIASLGIDVTDSRKTEEVLRSTNESMRVILDNIPVMIVVSSSELDYLYVNHHFEVTLGWSLPEVLIGDVRASLYPDPDYRLRVQEFFYQRAGTWADFSMSARDGRLLETSWIIVGLVDGTSIGIGINLTEIRINELLLREQNEELRRWHAITLGREERVLELKDEINQLLAQAGLPARYAGTDPQDQVTHPIFPLKQAPSVSSHKAFEQDSGAKV